MPYQQWKKPSISETLLRHLDFIETLLRHLLGIIWGYLGVIAEYKKHRKSLKIKDFRHFSRSEASGIRTPDNLIKSQVLYQLS